MLIQEICKSNLGHRLLYGLDEYLCQQGRAPRGFFNNLVRGSRLEERFKKQLSENEACIRYILTFLKKGGRLDVTEVVGTEEIDCARFFLKVLEVFGRVRVETEVVIENEEFWEVYAKVGAQALDLLAMAHRRPIKLESILKPLMEKFCTTSNWKLRSNIVRGISTTTPLGFCRQA